MTVPEVHGQTGRFRPLFTPIGEHTQLATTAEVNDAEFTHRN